MLALAHRQRMARKKERVDTVTEPLREALIAYCQLPFSGTARLTVAQRLFGAFAAKSLMPSLDKIAQRVRVREEEERRR